MLVASIKVQSDDTAILFIEGGPPVGAQMDIGEQRFPSKEDAAQYALSHGIFLEID